MSVFDLFEGDIVTWYARLATVGPTFQNFGPFNEPIIVRRIFLYSSSSAPFDQWQLAYGGVPVLNDTQFNNANLLWDFRYQKDVVPGAGTPNNPNINGSYQANQLIVAAYRINKPIISPRFFLTWRLVSSNATGTDKRADMEISWLSRPIEQLINAAVYRAAQP